MDHLRILLFGLLSVEKPGSNNYIIASYLLEHFSSIEKISTTSIAKDCGVSKSSVTRFCKDLGLEDLLDLQILYRGSQKESFSEKYNVSYHEYMPTLRNHVAEFEVNEEIIEEMVQVIHDHRVYLFGHMNSANAAFALQYDLHTAGKVVEVITNLEDQKRILENASQEEVIIIFTSENRLLGLINPRNKILPHARIYQISNVKIREPRKYVEKYIELDQEYNYAASLINMIIFANMIALKYYEKWGI